MNKKVEIKNTKPEDALIINKKKQVKEPIKDAKKKEPENIEEVKSINLIPKLSKEEVAEEKKKKTLNLGSVISLMVLVLITIVIVSFNIISKIQLNSEKSKLYKRESEIEAYSQKILANNEIKERIQLYKEISSTAYSPKGVIDYMNLMASRSGSTTISVFSFTNDLSFVIEGRAYNLEDVSKFWYLLTNDKKVEDVELESVNKGSDGARFKFKGSLIFEDFIKQQ
jgi:hypothetical protein